jgi:D-proline reductase (dithiol) PrdB
MVSRATSRDTQFYEPQAVTLTVKSRAAISSLHLEESHMARLTDFSQATQVNMQNLDCPSFERKPFVSGPTLGERRVAIVTSAGLIQRGERRFTSGDVDCRAIPTNTSLADLLMTHVSVNFDRTAFARDANVVFPLDRLNEMAHVGAGGIAALPVLEKGEVHATALRSWERGTSGRWHIHCAIELPSHVDPVALENLIRDCWAKVELGYGRILVRDCADAGWINYMLKHR